MADIVVLMSGGIDSSTLAYMLVDLGHKPIGLTIYYGQRHAKEIFAARNIANALKIQCTYVNLSALQPLLAKGALTGSAKVPSGDYSVETQSVTVVPNRNAILLNMAAAYAITLGTNKIAYAAHASDLVYPDCRKEFVSALEVAIQLGVDDKEFSIITPLIDQSKASIVELGLLLEVPFELTWSCYEGGSKACGVCGTCRERLKAFKLNKAKDPIEYEA